MLVDQFLADQAEQLLAEIETLPFVTEEMLDSLAEDVAKIDFRLRVESIAYAEAASSV